jgi:hypothetical protein
VKEGETGSCDF